jgi:hypothetical protein
MAALRESDEPANHLPPASPMLRSSWSSTSGFAPQYNVNKDVDNRKVALVCSLSFTGMRGKQFFHLQEELWPLARPYY